MRLSGQDWRRGNTAYLDQLVTRVALDLKLPKSLDKVHEVAAIHCLAIHEIAVQQSLANLTWQGNEDRTRSKRDK